MRSYQHLLSCLFLVFFILPSNLFGHAPNQSYIFVYVYTDSIAGYYEATTKDLDRALNLGLEGKTTVEAISADIPIIEKYILDHLSISSVLGEHPIQLQELEVLPIEGLGDFVKYRFKLKNVSSIPDALTIKYDGILEADPTHRGLQVVAYNWKAGILDNEAMVSLTFSPDNIEQELDLTESSIMKGVIAMIKSGIHHIWIGLDHILFILALVLPAVVRRQKPAEKGNQKFSLSPMAFSRAGGIWEPVAKFKPALIYVLTVITFFTISHSITLSLAALDVINLSSRLVESIIAFSIALAAYHNIRPIFKRDWVIAFAFGLFHGFGFASVLGEVGLAGEFMTLSLLGFNVGVELGQIAIILIAFPILFFIRKWKYYPQVLVYSSIFLIVIAMYWFTERALDINIPIRSIIGID